MIHYSRVPGTGQMIGSEEGPTTTQFGVPSDREGGQVTEIAQSAAQARMRNPRRTTFIVDTNFAVTTWRKNCVVKDTSGSC